jgi:hypothetical protein
MKSKVTLPISLTFMALLAGCSTTQAPSSPSTASLGNAVNVLQQGQNVLGAAQAMQSGSLTGLLSQQLGISQVQAQAGAGALFQVAKSQMQAAAFSQLSQSIPGMGAMLGAAPIIQGGYGGGLGSMVGLASAFQQSGMSANMIQRFIPIIVNYVESTAGSGMASSLSSAFLGL